MTTSVENSLLVNREPPLAWVMVNRPAARNALNVEVWKGLASAVERLGADSDVRVIIVRGAGDDAFISGADISEFQNNRADAQMAAAYDRVSARVWEALSGTPQPVIAMINGLCYGGGVSIAVSCDLRVAGDHARFAVPAVRLGLSYPFEAVERLVDIVGPTAASEMLLSGHVFDAQAACRIGLVNRIVPRAELNTVTRDYALAIAEGAPLSLAAHKRAIRECSRSPTARDLNALRADLARCYDSADYQEGIAAFLEKRKPKFQGQ